MSTPREDPTESAKQYLLSRFNPDTEMGWGPKAVLQYERPRVSTMGQAKISVTNVTLRDPTIGLRSILFPGEIGYERTRVYPKHEGSSIENKIETAILEAETDTEIEQIEEMELKRELIRVDKNQKAEEKRESANIASITKIAYSRLMDSCGRAEGQQKKARLEALRLFSASQVPGSPLVETLYINPDRLDAPYNSPQMIVMVYYPGKTPSVEFRHIASRQRNLLSKIALNGNSMDLQPIVKDMTAEQSRRFAYDVVYLCELGLLTPDEPFSHALRQKEVYHLNPQTLERFEFGQDGQVDEKVSFTEKRWQVTEACLGAIKRFHDTAKSLQANPELKPSKLSADEVLENLVAKAEEIMKYRLHLRHSKPGVGPTVTKHMQAILRNKLISPLYENQQDSTVCIGDANNSNFITIYSPEGKITETRVLDVFHCRLDNLLSDDIDFLQSQMILGGLTSKGYRAGIRHALELDGISGKAKKELLKTLPQGELLRAAYVLGAISGTANHITENPRLPYLQVDRLKTNLDEQFWRYFDLTVGGILKRDCYSPELKNVFKSILLLR